MSEFEIGSEDAPSSLNDIKDDYDAIEALTELLQFDFGGEEEIGRSLSRYNGATRISVIDDHESKIVRSPRKFLTVLRLLQREANTQPSHGLKVKKGSRFDYIHFLLELNSNCSVGVFFFDSKRMLSVPQVHNVERLIQETNLKGGIIVANNVGMPAKQEAHRINSESFGPGIITIEHYDSLEKRYLAG